MHKSFSKYSLSVILKVILIRKVSLDMNVEFFNTDFFYSWKGKPKLIIAHKVITKLLSVPSLLSVCLSICLILSRESLTFTNRDPWANRPINTECLNRSRLHHLEWLYLLRLVLYNNRFHFVKYPLLFCYYPSSISRKSEYPFCYLLHNNPILLYVVGNWKLLLDPRFCLSLGRLVTDCLYFDLQCVISLF